MERQKVLEFFEEVVMDCWDILEADPDKFKAVLEILEKGKKKD